MGVKKSQKRLNKEAFWSRLQMVARKYKQVMFVDANQVSSLQIAKIRMDLRAIGAYMIMGKNVSAPTSKFNVFLDSHEGRPQRREQKARSRG